MTYIHIKEHLVYQLGFFSFLGSHMSRNAVILRRKPSVWVELKINSNIPGEGDSINIADLKGTLIAFL